MWNRQANDGLPGHQNAVDGRDELLLREDQEPWDVAVRASDGTGLPLPARRRTYVAERLHRDVTRHRHHGRGIATGGAGVVVGPFEWVPNENVTVMTAR